jgi:hypothetical protein
MMEVSFARDYLSVACLRALFVVIFGFLKRTGVLWVWRMRIYSRELLDGMVPLRFDGCLNCRYGF